MIIAIDGPAASGKGTLGHKLSDYFDYAYLDTGALYRIVGVATSSMPLEEISEDFAVKKAKELTFKEILTLSKDSKIRTEDAGKRASFVSKIPEVRQALFDLQRNFAIRPVFEDGTLAKGAVLDGRDIGTVICPDAEIKLFLVASPETRATRRFKELQEKGLSVKYNDILSDIKARDERDSSRITAPLKPAQDALILDTSELNPEDVFATALRFINGKKTIGTNR
ncbi:MAG: (d)CMP kinase [Alphaproteobacteria bacterium]|nr:(d)CMP kinase [Alphaproteobacteria bacterium]